MNTCIGRILVYGSKSDIDRCHTSHNLYLQETKIRLLPPQDILVSGVDILVSDYHWGSSIHALPFHTRDQNICETLLWDFGVESRERGHLFNFSTRLWYFIKGFRRCQLLGIWGCMLINKSRYWYYWQFLIFSMLLSGCNQL